MQHSVSRRKLLGGVLLSGSLLGSVERVAGEPSRKLERRSAVEREDDPAPSRGVFLDTDRTRLGSIPVAGESHYLYRYDNVLADASGIEVWTSDGKVTARERVDRALHDWIWYETLLTFEDRGKELLDPLQAVRSQVGTIEALLADPNRVLQSMDKKITSIKRRFESVSSNFNLWQAFLEAYPSVAVTVEAIQLLADEVEEWYEPAAEAVEVLSQLLSVLEADRAPKQADFQLVDQASTRSRETIGSLNRTSNNIRNEVEAVQDEATELIDMADARTSSVLAAIESSTDVSVPASLESGALRAISAFQSTAKTLVNRLFDEVVDPVLAPIRRFESDTKAAKQNLKREPTEAVREKRLTAAARTRATAEQAVGRALAGGSIAGLFLLFNAWTRPTRGESR